MTTFEIPGPPVPKGRPRHTVTKTGHHWYTPERTVKAEEAVAYSAMAAGLKLEPKKNYSVEIDFYLSTHRRDLDNLAKLVIDGLQRMGDGWDDCQVTRLLSRTISVREGSEEKTVVRVREAL